MKSGARSAPAPEARDAVVAARARFEADLAGMPEDARDVRAPRAPVARLSDRLQALAVEARTAVLSGDPSEA